MEKADAKRTTRVITAVCLASAMCVLWAVQGIPLRIAFAAMTAASIWEVYDAFRSHGARPARWVGMTFAALLMPLYLLAGSWAIMPLIVFCCMLCFVDNIFRGEPDMDAVIVSLFPIVYPGTLCAMLMSLQDLSAPLYSTIALGQAFLIAAMSDTFAYLIGSRYGKYKLSPKISPKKTVEGAIAGMCAAIVFALLIPLCAWLAVRYIPAFAAYDAPLPPMWTFAVMGFFAGAAAQMGDLAASICKRSCGIKDFSTLFPGHGGVMDRMDSILFTGTVVYAFFRIIV